MSDNVDKIQIHGPVRDSALARFQARLDSWGVKMPRTETLVEDFGSGDFFRIGLIEQWITNEIAAGYCGKYLFTFDGQTCPLHCHKIKHETFFIVKGTMLATLDGKEILLKEGDSLAIAPPRIHSFTGVGDAMLLELSMPCHVEDNYFVDPKIKQWHKDIVAMLA